MRPWCSALFVVLTGCNALTGAGDLELVECTNDCSDAAVDSAKDARSDAPSPDGGDAAPVESCKNGKKDDAETDIDCGGPCTTRCGLSKGCNTFVDCSAELGCVSGKCVASCTAPGFDSDKGAGTSNVTVPSGCSVVRIKLWGGGGGVGAAAASPGANGGGGGFVSEDLAVAPGDVLIAAIGGAGAAGARPMPGGAGGLNGGGAGGEGGRMGANGGAGGGGGGSSSLARGLTILAIAAGGGGGGGAGAVGTPIGEPGGAGCTGKGEGGATSGSTDPSPGVAGTRGGGGGGGGGSGSGGAPLGGGKGGGGGACLGTKPLAGSGTQSGGATDPDYNGTSLNPIGNGGTASSQAGTGRILIRFR